MESSLLRGISTLVYKNNMSLVKKIANKKQLGGLMPDIQQAYYDIDEFFDEYKKFVNMFVKVAIVLIVGLLSVITIFLATLNVWVGVVGLISYTVGGVVLYFMVVKKCKEYTNKYLYIVRKYSEKSHVFKVILENHDIHLWTDIGRILEDLSNKINYLKIILGIEEDDFSIYALEDDLIIYADKSPLPNVVIKKDDMFYLLITNAHLLGSFRSPQYTFIPVDVVHT